MASKRQKGASWEFIVKRSKLLPKPLSLTFKSEAEGDAYCARLEALLDRGIVPTEFETPITIRTIADLITTYTRDHAVRSKDVEVLRTVSRTVGDQPLALMDADWVDQWVTGMKRVDKLAPSTIRSKVGALARCCDWGMRKKLLTMPDHPLRTLPEGYATYTDADIAFAGKAREDIERDRRVSPDEEKAIRLVLEKGVLSRKQRPRVIEHKEELTTLFDLALESGMRLREMYTLTTDQVDLKKRTVFLDKTKNGDKRQVPLSSVATQVLRDMTFSGSYVFPWWKSGESLKLTSNYISKLFAGVFEEAGCPDLHAHDLRHEATSRLFERTTLPVESIMKILGHKSHRMVMRYLNLRGSDLVNQLW